LNGCIFKNGLEVLGKFFIIVLNLLAPLSHLINFRVPFRSSLINLLLILSVQLPKASESLLAAFGFGLHVTDTFLSSLQEDSHLRVLFDGVPELVLQVLNFNSFVDNFVFKLKATLLHLGDGWDAFLNLFLHVLESRL